MGRWRLTDVSEEHFSFIFRVEEQDKQETNVEAKAGSKQILCDMLPRNVCWLSTDCAVLNPRRELFTTKAVRTSYLMRESQ
jgi:hypothetical protein